MKLAVDGRDVVDRQNQQLSDYEAELGLLRRRLESSESDRDRDKKQAALLQDALNRTRAVRSHSQTIYRSLVLPFYTTSSV